MEIDADSSECFARETFPDDLPSHDWDLLQLEQYAQAQHAAIVGGEKTLAPTYYRLGRCLEMIRRKRGRGAWGKYLESLGIHRVRACKARAIARHFGAPEAVAEIAVEEAYEQCKNKRSHVCRPRRRGPADSDNPQETQDVARSAGEKEADDIRAFLTEVCARVEALIDVAAFAEHERRAALFPAYRAALERLQFLGRMLGADDEHHASNG